VLSIVFSLFRSVISWAYMGAVAIVVGVVMLVLFPSRQLRICAFNVFGRLTGRVMVFFAGAWLPPGIRARMQAAHPAIYVSNHTSYLDNFLAAWAIPIGTVGAAKKETVWVPFFGQLYAISGNVLVNRTDRRGAAIALKTLVDLTQRHRLSAILWPEGTRSSDGRLQEFKRGFAHLALATKLPVVPVVVSGAHRCWPKGSAFTFPARVSVQILDPIVTSHWTAKNLDLHVAEVHARFVEHLPDDQKPLSTSATLVSQQ
jgi:1-acyl-sn-glycerol-3-phosphate acyltransferase